MKNSNHKLDSARKLLDIPRDATAEDIKRKYRELAKVWYPDINTDEDAHVKMQEIKTACAFIMKEEFGILDPWNEYDRWWRQYGDDPLWGNYSSEKEEHSEQPGRQKKLPGEKI